MTLPTVRLARSGLCTSRLAFGTSRLHYLDRHHRRRVLTQAADLGILHFDTAPAYGDGLSEVALGEFLRGSRSRYIVATKYGIPADPLIEGMPRMATVIRGAKAIARRAGIANGAHPPLTADGLIASVERSLKHIGTDWIDILFLHEPALSRMPDPDELLLALERLRERGLIRHFGLAGAWGGIADLGGSAGRFGQILQTNETGWPEDAPPEITFGSIAMGPQSAFAQRIDPAAAISRLQAALVRRPQGVVIVSTTSEAHLSSLVEAAAAASA